MCIICGFLVIFRLKVKHFQSNKMCVACLESENMTNRTNKQKKKSCLKRLYQNQN